MIKYQISVEIDVENEEVEQALGRGLDRFFIKKLPQKIEKQEIIREAIGYGPSIDTIDNQVSRPENSFHIRITKEKEQQPLTIMCNQCDWQRLVLSKDRAVSLSRTHYREKGHYSFETKKEKRARK